MMSLKIMIKMALLKMVTRMNSLKMMILRMIKKSFCLHLKFKHHKDFTDCHKHKPKQSLQFRTITKN